MKTLTRTACAVFETEDLESLYTFKNFPVFMGCTSSDISDDIYHDMSWSISRSSGLIQLAELLPLDVLYMASHGSGSVGKMWVKHHASFAEFINRFSPNSVIEIGGGHGILSIEYGKFRKIDWTIIEPNPTPRADSKAKIIKGFFNGDWVSDVKYDTVIHSHVFEHVYEPNVFMENLSSFMQNGSKLIFSVPNMQEMIKRKYTNCINFEHTIYITEPYIEYLLARHGFRLVSKEYFLEDHSIFYAAEKDSTVELQPNLDGLYARNKKLYGDYLQYHEDLITDLNENAARHNGDLFLFGAHVFAQYLINMGLDTRSVISILDNDENKEGKRLYGTNLLVESPKVLKNRIKPVVILKAGVYNDEIKAEILQSINDSTVFIE